MIIKCPICNSSYNDYNWECSKLLHTILGEGWEAKDLLKGEMVLVSCTFTAHAGKLIICQNKKIKLINIKPPSFIY